MSELTWQRFVLDREDGDELFAEIARSGANVFVRSGRAHNEPRIEIKQLQSEAAAERSVALRIATLGKQGYLEDGVVRGPVPEAPSRRSREEERAQRYAEARAFFDAALPEFVTAWRALGFDPTLTFMLQCRGTRLHPREITQRCLELVSRSFGVSFTERTRSYDDEHGAVRTVPASLSAAFYKSPAAVLAIAYGKLRGQAASTDDVDLPGLEDELLAKLRALA